MVKASTQIVCDISDRVGAVPARLQFGLRESDPASSVSPLFDAPIAEDQHHTCFV